jgi:Ricin-type beta-trefoil lectin domain
VVRLGHLSSHRRLLALAALALLGFAALIVAPATHASADTNWAQLYNPGTNLCLDSNADGMPGAVYNNSCNSGSYQLWSNNGNSQQQIVDLATGRCLDSNFSGNVYANGCNSGPYQVWNFLWDTQTGGYQLQDSETGLCLDNSSVTGPPGPVFTDACNAASETQTWL